MSARGSLGKANSDLNICSAWDARAEARSQVQTFPGEQNQDRQRAKRKSCGGAEDLGFLAGDPPHTQPAPLSPHEASTQRPTSRERGRQDLSFALTHLQASPSSKAGEDGGRAGGGGFSLPRPAPVVSTLATGNNPERASKARRNSDIVGAPGGRLSRGPLGGTLGPAAAAAAARSPESSSVIYKCHWKFFSSTRPASPPSPAWSRMWKVYGCARVGERECVSASEPLVCLDFSMQSTSDLTSRKEGQ